MKSLRLSILAALFMLPAFAWAQTTVPFSDGFEGATIVPPWLFRWDSIDTTINLNPAYVHSGAQSLQIYYSIPPNCGACDKNRYVRQDFSPKLEHSFIRGYYYFKIPEAGGEVDHVQRKLMYLWNKTSPSSDWSVVLDGWWHSPLDGKIWLAIAEQYHLKPGGQIVHWDLAALNFDQWYCLEMEVQANTPGLSDGVLRLWVDGVNKYQSTNRDLRGSFTDGLGEFWLGDQASTSNYPVYEYRYLDDIVIDDEYVGVIPDLPPLPPGTAMALLGSAGEVFDARKVGTTSAAKTVMLQSTGSGALTITSIAVSGDFARTHDCPITPATLASGDFCTISVTFTPTLGGARTGTLTVVDDAADTPQTAPLSGTGTLEVIVKGGASFSGGVTIR